MFHRLGWVNPLFGGIYLDLFLLWTFPTIQGVLKPEVVKRLHQYVAPIPYWDARNLGNLWMASDEILDFYIFGPLGDIARQVFQSPQAVTSHLPPSAQLQRDFISRRQVDSTNGWHIDRTESQICFLPVNFPYFSHEYDSTIGLWLGNLLNNRFFGEPSPSAFFPRSVRSVTNPPNTFRRHWQGLQCLWLWRVVCEALRSSIRASTLRPRPKKRGRSILQAKPCTARKVALNAGCCGTPIPLCQFFQEWHWIQRWSWSIGWNLEIFSCSTHVCGIARHHGQGPKLSWACSRPLPHPHISHTIHQCGRILFYPGVWTRDLKTKPLLCGLSMFFHDFWIPLAFSRKESGKGWREVVFIRRSWSRAQVGEGDGSPCFPYVYPEDKRPKVGSTLTFKRLPLPLTRPQHVVYFIFSWFHVQMRDILRKLYFCSKSWDFDDIGPLAVGLSYPLTANTCRQLRVGGHQEFRLDSEANFHSPVETFFWSFARERHSIPCSVAGFLGRVAWFPLGLSMGWSAGIPAFSPITYSIWMHLGYIPNFIHTQISYSSSVIYPIMSPLYNHS